MNKVELAIIVLVLIGIIVSSGTMVYTSTVISDLSTVKSDVSTLTESVANLTYAIGDLATILGDLAANVTERLTAIEAALATKETLIVGTTDSVELTLDPAQAYDYFGWCILQQIGGTLVAVKPGSTTGADFIPELATSWNASDDLSVWDFTLRQGVKFQDGTEFNATHVKYSFDRAIGLIPNIPEGAPAGLGYDAIINRTEVLGTYKVRFYLNMPFSPFLGILACRASTIVNPKYAPMAQVNYTAGDPRASTPVAFVGPYILSKWVRTAGRDTEIRLDANPNYWDASSGYPKMKHVIFRFYSDPSTLRLAIESGDIDMAFRHISPTDVLDLQNNPNVKIWWGKGAFIQYLCFQEKYAPFNDTRVRVAVTAALNRSALCNTVFLGLADPLYSIIPPGMLGHTEAFKKLGDANYTLTRSLLAEAGYNESHKLTFDLWYESSGHYPSSADQAVVIKEALEASGVIQVNLKSADWASYKQNRDNEIMDAYIYGWYPDYVDPDDYAFLYWAKWIHTNYDIMNPDKYEQQVDLYNQARATTNTTLRAQLYAQIDDIAVEMCSVVPLYVSSAWAVTKPNIYGIYLDITQDMRYWLIYR
ncbi:peptide ABC transporter substrate-binding protein [Candidatus Bathyarchaeota archaeon]|nr:peptide ABC transporter substrate-binding protein [Candidatus Bathyarchaeota archaeon]